MTVVQKWTTPYMGKATVRFTTSGEMRFDKLNCSSRGHSHRIRDENQCFEIVITYLLIITRK